MESLLNQPSLLVLIFQVDSYVNHIISRLASTTLSNVHNNASLTTDIINVLTIFCNSYTLMHRQNQLCIIATLTDSIHIIYPNSYSLKNNTEIQTNINEFIPISHNLPITISTHMNEAFRKQLNIMKDIELQSISSNRNTDDSLLYGSLAMSLSTSLTIINKQKITQSRILVLQFDKDSNQNYNALMNSIFSAQKLNVYIDALIISSFDSHLMQQACFLTNGLYIKHSDGNDVLQLLHTYFLPDQNTRKHLNIPTQKSIDFKAACYCHKRPVEFAYMCSVCLTLTCEKSRKCIVCQTDAR